jgi:hypothetical protein
MPPTHINKVTQHNGLTEQVGHARKRNIYIHFDIFDLLPIRTELRIEQSRQFLTLSQLSENVRTLRQLGPIFVVQILLAFCLSLAMTVRLPVDSNLQTLVYVYGFSLSNLALVLAVVS